MSRFIMATTREKVLKTLLTRKRCSINDLAEAVGINPISVRHHINKLEAASLVTSEEEKHGVGRPRLVYFLTEKGMEQFPSRYLQLTVRLLKQLKETLPKPMVGELFTQMADDLAADYASELELEELPIEKRLDLVKDLLGAEGFTMEWEHMDDGYHIREVSCPYYHIGQSHPEVCAIDEALISHMLAVPIEKVKCLLDGDSYCTYIVPDSEETESNT
ncbi:MAG: winged helix-turn-helix transcriptional regulator [Anaerolineales bacterium]|nr:winged helix-turn-helix transcriptional regulator [Anaerolineales bacterium]